MTQRAILSLLTCALVSGLVAPAFADDSAKVKRDEEAKARLLSILSGQPVLAPPATAQAAAAPATQLAGPGQKGIYQIPSSGQVKAPYAFQLAAPKDDNNFYSLFASVDLTSYGYCLPPDPPANPDPPDNANGIGTGGVTFQWTCTDPDAGAVLTFDIYLDTVTPPSRLVRSAHSTTSYTYNQALNAGTVYYWKIIATDDCGESTEGPVWKFTTAGTPPPDTPTPTPTATNTPQGPSPTPTLTPTNTPSDPPAAPVMQPEGLYTQNTCNEVCWDPVQGAADYFVEWSLSPNFTSTIADSGWIPATQTCYTATNLPEGQRIYYRVRARNSQGQSAWSNVVSSTQDATPPSIRLAGYGETNLTQSEGGQLLIVAWAVDNVNTTEVEIYFGGQPQGAYLNEDPGAEGIFTLTFTLGPGEAPPSRNTLELIARDEAGNESQLWPYFHINLPPTDPCATTSLPPPKNDAALLLRALRFQAGLDPVNPLVDDETRAQLLDWTRYYGQVVRGSSAKGATPRPYVFAGGYWDSNIRTDVGGQFTMAAAVTHPSGLSSVQKVEMFFGGSPTGVELNDRGQSGDAAANDSIFTFSANLPPLEQSTAGQYTLEILATDFGGNSSTLWPYLTIGN